MFTDHLAFTVKVWLLSMFSAPNVKLSFPLPHNVLPKYQPSNVYPSSVGASSNVNALCVFGYLTSTVLDSGVRPISLDAFSGLFSFQNRTDK